MIKCKKKVWAGNRPTGLTSHQCKRNATKDGYCNQHHPDEDRKRNKKRADKLALTPFNMIHRY